MTFNNTLMGSVLYPININHNAVGGSWYHDTVLSNRCSFALLQMKDCTLSSSLFALDGPSTASLSISNYLFERIGASFRSSAKIDAHNNLFRYGTNTLVNASGTWTFKDYAFDLSVVNQSGYCGQRAT